MKESLIYINTNIECILKLQNNTKDHRVQYKEYLPKNSIFS